VTTLDPAQNKEAPYPGLMTAIYGQLFELGAGGKVVPDLARLHVQPRAKTSPSRCARGEVHDGTPFNAQAVAYNWERDSTDSDPATASTRRGHPRAAAEQSSGTPEPPACGGHRVTGPYTIVVHQSAQTGPSSTSSSTRSPMDRVTTALQKEGSQFGQ